MYSTALLYRHHNESYFRFCVYVVGQFPALFWVLYIFCVLQIIACIELPSLAASIVCIVIFHL